MLLKLNMAEHRKNIEAGLRKKHAGLAG